MTELPELNYDDSNSDSAKIIDFWAQELPKLWEKHVGKCGVSQERAVLRWLARNPRSLLAFMTGAIAMAYAWQQAKRNTQA